MFAKSKNVTYTRALVAAMLGSLATRPAGPLLTTPTVHLFSAVGGTITPNTVIADFTQCTFAGYAPVVLPALSAVVNLEPTYTYGSHAECDWVAGAIVSPGQFVLGYWIDDGATTLYASEQFGTAVPLVLPGDFISLDIILGLYAIAQVGL